MKKFLKNKNGITLIALVITIIVLLILAGVSINLISGSNGIINRAQTAVDKTNLAQIKEEIELKLVEMQMDYYSESSLQLTYENESAYIIAELQKGISLSSGAELTYDVAGDLLYNDTKVEIDAQSNNKRLIPKYGDKVNYSAGGVTDWKIFLKDENNVYIIASDYVPIASSGIKQVDNLYIKNSYALGATNNRTTLVDWLATTAYWSGFVNSTYATSATGGPTQQQYIDSWNAKGYRKLYINTTLMSDGLTGYYLGTEENPTTHDISAGSAVSYNDTLYYPHRSEWNDTYGYWLASPSAYGENYIMRVHCNGIVSKHVFGDASYGVRPLVCLKSDVKMTWDGEKWNLSI